jgi:hypothetical protein
MVVRHDLPPGESSLWRFRSVPVIGYEEHALGGIDSLRWGKDIGFAGKALQRVGREL